MSSNLFNTLGIGYSGLAAAQVGITVTGHNISNAETEGYTRQRVVFQSATPLTTTPGQIGNGVEVQDIQRVFDNYVYDRYTTASSDKAYSDYEMQTLETLSSYFPEIDGVGIKADLAEYYDMWQTFADNPDNDAIKTALASQTETLTSHIQQTQEQMLALQQSVNDELAISIEKVNELAAQIAELNKSIDVAESGSMYEASDLRDKRNLLEKNLSDLIGATVTDGQLEANDQINSNSNDKTSSYTISVNGFNIVDGGTFHPLRIDNSSNEYGFYEVSYERQDGTLIPLEEKINDGKVGAIFELRGRAIDETTGMPTDGVLQTAITQMDAFSKGLIESTNNLYAQSSTTSMQSNTLEVKSSDALMSSNLNLNEGSFDIVIYDIDGNEVARRTIEINVATTMSGIAGSNSIEGQITQNQDDNGDLNGNNDIDDFLLFNYQPSATGELQLELDLSAYSQSQGFTFSISDNLQNDDYSSGTNFAGATGLHRFLDGENARDIDLNFTIAENPTLMKAGYSSASGDNTVALDMIQQQFENYDFYVGRDTYNTTISGMFDISATYVGIKTNAAITRNETVSTQYNATELEYASISQVSIDEEMTNLIKYQTSYGAAAKLITTVDQMMQTLLGMKQ